MGVLKDELRTQLEAEVRAKGLCVWLDSRGDYSDFVGELITDQALPFPVLRFEGSLLALMLALGPLLSQRSPVPCLVHMPGFNEQNIRQTPLLEAYEAGKRLAYNLQTLVKRCAAGRLSPEVLQNLLDDPEFSLERADQRLSEEDETPPALKRLIARHSLLEICLDLLRETRAYDDLIEAPASKHGKLMQAYLRLQLGLSAEWLHFWQLEEPVSDDTLAALRLPLAAFLTCAEYVADLKAAPKMALLEPLRALGSVQLQNARRVVQALRQQQPERYGQLAREVEAQLGPERAHAPEDFGVVDTFAFEEEKILERAFGALAREDWATVSELARQRLGSDSARPSFWVAQDQSRRWVWQWLDACARLGRETARVQARLRHWSSQAMSPRDMLSEYTAQHYSLDQAHRAFTQRSAEIKSMTQLPHFAQILERGRAHKAAYREVVSQMTRLFNAACQQHGFLPEPEYQQRYFHAHEIAPRLARQPTVVFYIDAFRYELGAELAERLRAEAGEVKLSARLAELPSVTAVGMNALLPLSHDGQLTPSFDKRRGKFQGFRSGEKDILGPQQREKLLRAQLDIPMQWLSLHELAELSAKALQTKLAGKKLVVVHSLEIDELGETGLLDLFPSYFEETLNRLVSALHRLQKCGYEHFVLTADHGFLQADETLQGEKLKHVALDTRRYILHAEQLESSKVTSVPLSQLGYKGCNDWLVLPQGTDLFQKPGPKDRFYHGGNSLQERVVPVLALHKKRAPRMNDDAQLRFEVQPAAPMMGRQRIRLTVRREGPISMFDDADVVLQLSTPDPRVILSVDDIHPGQRQGNQITVPVDQPCEIFFTLASDRGGKVPLQLSQPLSHSGSEAHITEMHFEVLASVSTASSAPAEAAPAPAPPAVAEVAQTPWPEQIPPEFHPILSQLKTHGAITEGALSKMLGGGAKGARQARRFAAKIEGWLPLLPFNLRVTQTPEGKSYEVSP